MKKFRKFKSADQSAEKNNSGVYMAILLAVVMVGGVGGIFLYNSDNGSSYVFGKYKFTNDGTQWSTKINKKQTSFYFLPNVISNLNVSQEAVQLLKSSSGVIITFNPDENISTRLQALDLFKFELGTALYDSGKQVAITMTKNSSIYNFPILNCENSTTSYPVLYVDYGTSTKAEVVDGCIMATATDEQNLLMLTDNLRYSIYGVYNE